jgi:hypothetical protein
VPVATATRKVKTPSRPEQPVRARTPSGPGTLWVGAPAAPHGPVSEQARPEPRFRVVTRKPTGCGGFLPRRRSRLNPLPRTLLISAFPALALMVYVMFWTLAVRGGFYKSELQTQLKNVRIEQAELQATKRRMQSPGLILERAAQLGMQPAVRREFARLPVPQQVAQGNVGR